MRCPDSGIGQSPGSGSEVATGGHAPKVCNTALVPVRVLPAVSGNRSRPTSALTPLLAPVFEGRPIPPRAPFTSRRTGVWRGEGETGGLGPRLSVHHESDKHVAAGCSS